MAMIQLSRGHAIFRNGNIYYQISQVNLSYYIVQLQSTLLRKFVTYKKTLYIIEWLWLEETSRIMKFQSFATGRAASC